MTSSTSTGRPNGRGTAILVDTHVIVWLYQGALEKIPNPVRERLDAEPLGLSPIVVLELAYLYERGRVGVGPEDVVRDLEMTIGLRTLDHPFGRVIAAARDLAWTRDPFDRLLCGHALAAHLPLVTADRSIRDNLPLAWWPEA